MILLIVRVKILEGKKKEFLEIAEKLIKGSQKEKGCVEYNLYEDLDDRNTVAFVEKYKDKNAVEEHEKSAHFIDNIGKIVAFIDGKPSREIYSLPS